MLDPEWYSNHIQTDVPLIKNGNQTASSSFELSQVFFLVLSLRKWGKRIENHWWRHSKLGGLTLSHYSKCDDNYSHIKNQYFRQTNLPDLVSHRLRIYPCYMKWNWAPHRKGFLKQKRNKSQTKENRSVNQPWNNVWVHIVWRISSYPML